MAYTYVCVYTCMHACMACLRSLCERLHYILIMYRVELHTCIIRARLIAFGMRLSERSQRQPSDRACACETVSSSSAHNTIQHTVVLTETISHDTAHTRRGHTSSLAPFVLSEETR